MIAEDALHSQSLNILVIDNDTATVRLIKDTLCAPIINIAVSPSYNDARKRLQADPTEWHCWIIDIDLGGSDDGLQLINEFNHYPFFIILSGLNNMRLSFKAAQLGALDIFDKQPALLLNDFIDSVFRVVVIGYLLRGKRTDYLSVFLSLKNRIFTSASQWAEYCCISLRYLERLCEMHCGLSPRYVLPLYYYLYSLLYLSESGADLNVFNKNYNRNEKKYFKYCHEFIFRHLATKYSFLKYFDYDILTTSQ